MFKCSVQMSVASVSFCAIPVVLFWCLNCFVFLSEFVSCRVKFPLDLEGFLGM